MKRMLGRLAIICAAAIVGGATGLALSYPSSQRSAASSLGVQASTACSDGEGGPSPTPTESPSPTPSASPSNTGLPTVLPTALPTTPGVTPSPSPSPTPSASPTPAERKCRSTITLTFKRRGFAGKVRSDADECIVGRRVLLMKDRKDRKDAQLGKTLTNDSGSYRFAVKRKAIVGQRFYTKTPVQRVPGETDGTTTCMAARSRSIRP